MFSKIAWKEPTNAASPQGVVGKINLSRRIYSTNPTTQKYESRQQSSLSELSQAGIQDASLRANGTGPPKSSSIGTASASLGKVQKDLRSMLHMTSFAVDDQRSIYQCLKVWLELFQIYGFEFDRHPLPSLLSCFKPCLDTIRIWYSLGLTWMDYFKYKNATFFSAWMNQELPPCKGVDKRPSVLLGGAFYQFLRTMKRAGTISSFALSILMSKKAMPRPTKTMVLASVNKNVLTMTRHKVTGAMLFSLDTMYGSRSDSDFYWNILNNNDFHNSWSPEPQRAITFDRNYLAEEIRRTVREIFKDCELDKNILLHPFTPSISASYESKSKDSGGFGHIDRNFHPSIPDLELTPTLVGVKGHQSASYGVEGIFEEVARDSDIGKVTGFSLSYEKFKEPYEAWYWRLFDYARDEEIPMVKVVGLQEALKIRNISKGPSISYFVMKPLQNFMWRQLQRFWNFELTGQPITEELFNKRFRFPGLTARFHSGDYSDATNELHSWCSEEAIDAFIDMWPDRRFAMQLRGIMLKCMVNHEYDHVQVDEAQVMFPEMLDFDQTDPYSQKRGQLMGSILSFVFLCIINISLMRAAYEFTHECRWQCSLGLRDDYSEVSIKTSKSTGKKIYSEKPGLRPLPVWVNGDDCLTAYTATEFPKVWEGMGDVMGLSKSIGKTYDSPNMASINSRFFQLEPSGRWTMIPFVNGGLLHNVKRSVAKEGEDKNDVMIMGSKYRDMMECCQNDTFLQEQLRERYLYVNRKTLATYKGPWHYPIHFGGLDLPLRPMNYIDRQRCSAMREKFRSGKRVPSRIGDATFKMYTEVDDLVGLCCPDKVWFKEFKKEWEEWKDYDGSDGYGKLYTSLCYRVWSETAVDKLYKGVNNHSYKNMLNYMTRLYREACSDVARKPKISPIPMENLVYKTKESFCPLIEAEIECC